MSPSTSAIPSAAAPRTRASSVKPRPRARRAYWAYRITGRIAGGGQHTEESEDFRGVIMPQITYRPNDQNELTVYAQFAALDQINVGGGFRPATAR